MSTAMTYRPDADTDDFRPGDWKYFTATGRERAGLIVMLPNGELAAVNADRWDIKEDAQGLTVMPSIHHKSGQGSPGEWHGFIVTSHLMPC